MTPRPMIDSGPTWRPLILITMASPICWSVRRTRTSAVVPDSGLAQVIWGSSSGLGKGRSSTELTQSDFGRTATADDQLGFAVDATNELGSDLPMVAVGVPGGNVSGANDAGWAGFFTAGLNDPRAIDQDSAGIPGAAEANDRFGEAITLGQLAGTSNRVDAAVGTPG